MRRCCSKIPGRFRVLPAVSALVFLVCTDAFPDPLAVSEAFISDTRENLLIDHQEAVPSSSASVSTSLGRARADVDLATGTLRASVATFSTGVAPDRGAEVRAGAIFQDRFTFHGNEATWLTATMSVTGALHRDAGLSNNLLTFGDPGLAQDLLPSAEAADLVINTTQAMVYYAIPNEPFELGATLAAWGYGWDGGNVSVDFSNTARLSFQLPEGAWITSEGGFSQDGSPVPLPSTLLLLGFRSFRLDALDEARARARCSGSSSREI